MLKEFLKRYLIPFAIAIACWVVLIYFTITEPENFLTGESVIWALLAHFAGLGCIVGLILHSWDWVSKNKDKKW